MFTAAGLVDRLRRVTLGDDRPPEGAWIRVIEAIGGTNRSATVSENLTDPMRERWNKEFDRLLLSAPNVDWSEVSHRRGLVRELTLYLDAGDLA